MLPATGLMWSSLLLGWVPVLGEINKLITKIFLWHFVSNMTPLIPLILAFFYLYGLREIPGSFTWFLSMELVSVAMWYRTMKISPAAIRWLDNDWNKVSSGQLLYPSILYLLSIKQYNDALVADFIEERNAAGGIQDSGDDKLPEEEDAEDAVETSVFLVSM